MAPGRGLALVTQCALTRRLCAGSGRWRLGRRDATPGGLAVDAPLRGGVGSLFGSIAGTDKAC